MNKKVIAIIRTSTTQQEIDSQRKEVINMALKDGYCIDEIVVVGKAGASAIKVDDAYIENMNKVYELLEKVPTIEAVYAWAIDRIGRNEEILMRLKNTLVKKHIQLVIKNPSLRLLEKDGTVNSGVELAFALFATMAKQEMEQKQARFMRGRKRNDEQGRYNGGYIAFGYKVENGKIVVNEEEAKIVRLIFTELASGKYSCDGLARELQSRGILFKGKKLLFSNVRGILKNKIYCGEQLTTTGIVRNIPPIVSKELYSSAIRAIASNNPSKTNSTTNRFLFGLRLITCPICGCHFSVAAKLYQCHNHNRNGYDSRKDFTKCSNGISIGVANLDRLLWYAASCVHFEYLTDLINSRNLGLDERIAILKQKVTNLQNEIESLTEKRKRINEVYMDNGITREERDSKFKKLISDKDSYSLKIREFEEEITGLEALKNGDNSELFFDNIRALMLLDNKELQCKIVRKHIKSVGLDRSSYKNYKRVLKIRIEYFNHAPEEFLYVAKSLGEFFQLKNGELVSDEQGNPKPIPNINALKNSIWSEEDTWGKPIYGSIL